MLYFLKFSLPLNRSHSDQLSGLLIFEQCTYQNYFYGHISIFNSLTKSQSNTLASISTSLNGHYILFYSRAGLSNFFIIKFIHFMIIYAITVPRTIHIGTWKCYDILSLKVPVESIQGYNIVCRLSILNSYLYMRLKFLI